MSTERIEKRAAESVRVVDEPGASNNLRQAVWGGYHPREAPPGIEPPPNSEGFMPMIPPRGGP